LAKGINLLATAQALPTQGLLGGFRRISSWLRRTLNEVIFQNGIGKSKHIERGETGIFAEDDAEIIETGQQN